MPVMNGFEFLEQFKEISFAIIFTTSYDQYAIKAIRFSALDYLLKPIDPKELVTAVQKVQNTKTFAGGRTISDADEPNTIIRKSVSVKLQFPHRKVLN